MAANASNGPSWWDDPPPGGTSIVDSSQTGATLPNYMDSQGLHGALHLLRLTSSEDRPLPNIPFMIRKSIEAKVGRIDGAYKESGGSYTLKVRSLNQLKLLLCMDQLHDGTKIKIIEHPTLNSTKCVVSCGDVIDLSETELLTELADQGIKEIRRITRKEGKGRVNTPTIILTCKGTVAPKTIDFGYIRCKTRPFYPNPMQCYNCWAFGHTRTRCQSKENICGKCSQGHPVTEDRNCSNAVYCKSCDSNDHALSSRSCPSYKRENDIQRIKVDKGIPYAAARRLYDSIYDGPSYATVTNQDNNDVLRSMNEKIKQLTRQLAQKDKFIEEILSSTGETITLSPVNSRIDAVEKQMSFLSSQIERFISAVMPAASMATSSFTPLSSTAHSTATLTSERKSTSISPQDISEPEFDPLGSIFTDSENRTPTNYLEVITKSSNISGKPSSSKSTAPSSKENTRQTAPKNPRTSLASQLESIPSKRSLSNLSPVNQAQQKKSKAKK